MQLFQGEKPAHDFLSLHTGGGSSSPVQHSTQAAGYQLGVHNSLKPLKLGKRRGRGGEGAISVAPSMALEADSEEHEHVLPGGVGTFSIRQVASATQSSHGVVVRGAAFPPAVHGSRTAEGPPTQGTESGARAAHSGPATMWQDSGMDQRSRGARGGGEGRSRSSGSSADQGPNTPRSKHSATEQRRRTKINDRLEILRELLPHGDQKRDKASFLLEVIEYIRFLQEKVQKYESAHPQKNHEDSSMPWAKVYYRSCWKNTENTNQGLAASTQDTNKEQYGSKQTTVASSALFDTQSARETSANDISSQKATSRAQSRADNNIPSKQPAWLSMSTSNSDNRTLSKNEKETLHEDAQSLSDAYSQGLLNRLTQALERSGVDPSQASISVKISMDRRATEPNNIHDGLKDNECEGTIHVTKKLRCERS